MHVRQLIQRFTNVTIEAILWLTGNTVIGLARPLKTEAAIPDGGLAKDCG
jgi:hypothetical protein